MTYFIALIVFLLPSYLVRFSIFGVPTTLLEILIYIAAIITLILKLKTKNEKLQLKTQKLSIINYQFSIPIILFILSGIISVIIAPDKRDALGLLKAYILDPIIFFWIIVSNFKIQIFNFQSNSNNLNSKLNSYDLWLKALIASGVVVALHAIWQKITGQMTVDGRVLGIFSLDPNTSPNYLAFYLAPIATLAFSQLSNQLLVTSNQENQIKKFIPTLSLVTCCLLLFFALWFTGSRAAIGAVIIGTISYFVISYWQQIKSKKYLLFLVTLLLVTLSLFAWQASMPDWQATPDAGRISSSNNIRWEIWKTTIDNIIPRDNNWLLGVGLGNYQDYFSELTKNRVNYPEWISPWAHTPHNLFLNILVNLGLLGLVSLLWILAINFKFLIFNFYSNSNIKNSKLTPSHLSLTAMMVTILAQGLVDSPIWKNDLTAMFWLILALALIISPNQPISKS